MGIRQHISTGTLLRYLLAFIALGWVLTIVEWQRILSLLWDTSPTAVVAVLAVSILGIIPRVWMWVSLLSHFQRVEFSNVLFADLVVKFVNTLFPSRFAGRSIAPLALRHYTGVTWAEATAVTGVHTGLYAICYALVCLGGIVLLAASLSPGVLALMGLSTTAYVIVGGVILLGGTRLYHIEEILTYFANNAASIPVVGERVASLVSGIPGVIADSATGFRTIITDRRAVLGYGFSWILALAIFPSLRVYILFVEFGVTPEMPWLLPLYLITAYGVTVLPLTPGGIGIAEATSTLVFVALGYPATVVIPVVVLDRFLGVYLPALAGWYPTSTAEFNDLVSDSA